MLHTVVACLYLAVPAAGAGLEGFPVTTQFTPLPEGPGWTSEEQPLTPELIHATIDAIIAHGFTGIEAPRRLAPQHAAEVLEYAAERGLFVTAHVGALEGFGRKAPPGVCVYSDAYEETVRARAERLLAHLEEAPNLYNAFTYQDEPFHWGPESFGVNDEVKAEFRARYGYALPDSVEEARRDPAVWLDYLNFRSDYFADGWRKVYPIIKEIDPSFQVIMTHDSHNTFGAGAGSHAELAMDDVYHWGGEFADIFVYDIYPYMSLDYRFGEVGQLRQPRQATTHYSFAQMRNLTRSYGKDLGFWFGTYNPRWFNGFLRADMAAMAWSEREMAFTAVAQGADWLITGYGIPVHAGHWRELGEGLRLLQQGGAEILETERARAPVALLFPRTHYLHTQREYWNVCGAFELVLRAFGEVEIIHEEQVEQGELSDYKMLLLFDTEILTEAAAERIAAFVRGGGALLADAIPDKDERLEPLDALEGLFGAEGGEATRIPRSGHWIEYRSVKPRWYLRPEDPPDENDFETATLMDEQLGEIRLVSPREVNVTNGEMLLSTEDGAPALMRHEPGPGRVYLLGFCLQDTYWEAWTEYDAPSREGLRALIRRITDDAGLRSHVHSSNPQIEAALRANDRVAFLFVINHETEDGETVVTLRGLPFELARAADLATGEPAAYKREGDSLVFDLNVPLGEVTLIRLGAQ